MALSQGKSWNPIHEWGARPSLFMRRVLGLYIQTASVAAAIAVHGRIGSGRSGVGGVVNTLQRDQGGLSLCDIA